VEVLAVFLKRKGKVGEGHGGVIKTSGTLACHRTRGSEGFEKQVLGCWIVCVHHVVSRDRSVDQRLENDAVISCVCGW